MNGVSDVQTLNNTKNNNYKSKNGRLQKWPQSLSILVHVSLCKMTLQLLSLKGGVCFSNY